MDTHIKTHSNTHTPLGRERWSWACSETFQSCDLIIIQSQRWEDEQHCVPRTAHPLQERDVHGCECVCVGWVPPNTHTYTSSWEIGGLCFLSGCPLQQTPGASCLVGIWSSHSTDAPSLQIRRKTRPEEDSVAHLLLLSPIFFPTVPLLCLRPLLFFTFFCLCGR